MYRLEFRINKLPPNPLNGRHGSWRAKAAARKFWKELAIAAIGPEIPEKPLKKAKCTFTRHSSAEPDFDGLVASFKPVVDSLKAAKVIEDDKPSVIGQPEYRWEKAKRGEGSVTVTVEEIEG